jgi:uncharacterized protein YjbI with pentapeptide repeats
MESNFYNVELNKIEFTKVDFTSTEFYKTSLKNIDFSTSIIDSIKITPDCIKGMKVNTLQALDLVKVLEIEIVE